MKQDKRDSIPGEMGRWSEQKEGTSDQGGTFISSVESLDFFDRKKKREDKRTVTKEAQGTAY